MELALAVATIDETLVTSFGLAAFRPWQREAIEQLLDGPGQVLVVAPTGGGKSLCYQLPATMLSGTTVVISPLIALMDDQVRGLSERGIPATYLASTLDDDERRARIRRIEAGHYRLIYVAPERLRSERFVACLGSLSPPLVAIDEAHCISHWGHDFRPDYLRIGEVLRGLAPPRVLACTATATPAVRDEILERLGLERERTRVVLRGFARPNLHLEVRELDDLADRRKLAMATLREVHTSEGGAAIFYAGTRKLCERMTGELREKKWRAAAYHAGLEPHVREQVSRTFAAGELDVVVATNAFGMGIDRPDIRLVAHLQAPGSIEQYYQEVGRGGRDGRPARGLLLSGSSDMGLRRRLIELGRADRGERAAGSREDGAWLDWQWQLFLDLMRYVEAGSCRHDFILRYFGDEGETLGGCGHCDVCERLEATESEGGGGALDGDAQTLMVRKALAGVARLAGRAGLRVLALHLQGGSDERIRRLGLDQLTTHGVLREHPPEWVLALLRRLITARLVDVTTGEYPVPFLTATGRRVMKGEEASRVLVPAREQVRRGSKAPRSKGPRIADVERDHLPVADRQLFERLRELRMGAARDKGVPAYVVCPDRTLVAMAQRRPQSVLELGMVHGMGPARIDSYGELFLTAIRAEP